jgi:hypothetical protein
MRIVLFLAALAASAESIDQLGFMSGCWAFEAKGQRTEEIWTKPAGGTMAGLSRTMAGGKTVFTEFTQIRDDEGKLTMFVSLKIGGAPTAFRLTSITASEAVFTSELDFPRRLIYRKEKDGLFARTEGTQKGKAASEDFPYKPASCSAAR